MATSRSDNMVEQVLFDILLYLPVRSLLRFKIVCKDWFSIIESSTFVSKHLNHHRKEDNLIFHANDEPKLALLSGNQYEECVYVTENWQWWHANDVELICSCDGIVCLGHRDEIALWNPSLNQFRLLPPSLSSLKTDFVHMCFGIDIKSNDYKVVRIYLEYREGTKEFIRNQVEVYNLAGDNSWKTVHEDGILPFQGFVSSHEDAKSSSKSGMCFWRAFRSDFREEILLAFDFNEDLFRAMLLPHVQQEDILYRIDLLDDKVVCIIGIRGDDDYCDKYEIWMLHEFGVEESWNKIYNIGPLPNPSAYAIGISKNGEFLICGTISSPLQQGKDGLFLYDIRNQQGTLHQDRKLDFYMHVHYNPSLLSLKSVNKVVRPFE